MRYLPLVFSTCLLIPIVAASDADAQFTYRGPTGCAKGIFWPFSREKGDCLTRNEIQSGMTGNYQDPEGTYQRPGTVPLEDVPPATAATPNAPDAAAATSTKIPATVAPDATETPAQTTTIAPDIPPSPTPRADAPLIGAAATQSTPAADLTPSPNPVAEDRTEYTGPGGCLKGLFWPFVRRPGDCLTAAEMAAGMTGNYRDPDAVSAIPAAGQPSR